MVLGNCKEVFSQKWVLLETIYKLAYMNNQDVFKLLAHENNYMDSRQGAKRHFWPPD